MGVEDNKKESNVESSTMTAVSKLIGEGIVGYESALLDIKTDDGEALVSHAFKLEFPNELMGLATNLATEFKETGKCYIGMIEGPKKFTVMWAYLTPKT